MKLWRIRSLPVYRTDNADVAACRAFQNLYCLPNRRYGDPRRAGVDVSFGAAFSQMGTYFVFFIAASCQYLCS